MRMETYIRKSLGMTAHRVREVVQTEQGLEAMVEQLRKRHLKCSECGMEVNAIRG